MSEDSSKAVQQTEKMITDHFVYMHGVLQNLETSLKERLRHQRDNLKADVEHFRQHLSEQEEMLGSIYAVSYYLFIFFFNFPF